jgi:hypothetical protein
MKSRLAVFSPAADFDGLDGRAQRRYDTGLTR